MKSNFVYRGYGNFWIFLIFKLVNYEINFIGCNVLKRIFNLRERFLSYRKELFILVVLYFILMLVFFIYYE